MKTSRKMSTIVATMRADPGAADSGGFRDGFARPASRDRTGDSAGSPPGCPRLARGASSLAGSSYQNGHPGEGFRESKDHGWDQ